MTIDDLFLEQQLSKMNKLDTAWARFQSEAQDIRNATRVGFFASVRGAVASTLVRAGVRLDRRAGERVVAQKRVAAPQPTEGHHAISW